MTFGPGHYVPVLKVKRGEKRALRCISPTIQQRITPLLEIVERKADRAPTVSAHIDTAFKDLADSVRPYPRCLLDTREIATDGEAAANKVFRRASAAGIVFTPVTGLSRTADVPAALDHRKHGVALRLTREEFEAGRLPKGVMDFVSKHKLAPEATDIIIDLGPVEDFIPHGVANLTDQFLAAVPNHRQWRTLTVSACAFPKSMRVVGKDSHALIARVEWIAWRDRLHARRRDLPRLPTFSDCAIQYPEGVEGFDFRLMEVSAAVRYAVADSWLLIKGESTRTTVPGVQFSGLARKLVHGSLRSHFLGADHCAGCRSMKEAARGAPGLGSAEVWRRLGTIHHVTTVMQQLDALP